MSKDTAWKENPFYENRPGDRGSPTTRERAIQRSNKIVRGTKDRVGGKTFLNTKKGRAWVSEGSLAGGGMREGSGQGNAPRLPLDEREAMERKCLT